MNIEKQIKRLTGKKIDELYELKRSNVIIKKAIFDSDLSGQEKKAVLINDMLVNIAIIHKEVNSSMKDTMHFVKGEVDFILNMNF